MTRHSKSRKWKFKRKNPAWAARGAQENNECGLVWGSGIIPKLSRWDDHQYQGIQGVVPGGSDVKNPPANAGDVGRHRFDPWVGKITGGGNGNPLQYSCWNFHGPKSLEGSSSRDCRVGLNLTTRQHQPGSSPAAEVGELEELVVASRASATF